MNYNTWRITLLTFSAFMCLLSVSVLAFKLGRNSAVVTNCTVIQEHTHTHIHD